MTKSNRAWNQSSGTMTEERQPTIDSRLLTTFATDCCVAAVLVALAACTVPNPDYRPPLKNLSVSPGSLVPAFDSDATTYSVDVASDVSSVAVTANPQDSEASMSVNGQETSSGQERTISLNGTGVSTPISVVVMASNGRQNTYMVTVNRAASGAPSKLQSLSVSPGTLAPVFEPNTTAYSVAVAGGVGSVGVTAIPQDSKASMIVNGQETSSGQERTVSLNGQGANTPISIVVMAATDNQNTYVVTVNRATLSGNNALQSLSVFPGSIVPPFVPTTKFYSVTVDSSVNSVTVTAVLQDIRAIMTVNGQGTSSGQPKMISLSAAGFATEIPIVVAAENGSQNNYVMTVHRGT